MHFIIESYRLLKKVVYGFKYCTFKHQQVALFLECVISGPKKLRTNSQCATRLSTSLYECITVGAGVCMAVFCMSILLCVHLWARAGA